MSLSRAQRGNPSATPGIHCCALNDGLGVGKQDMYHWTDY